MQAFAENSDVAFGDVLLSEQQIRGNHNPGAGGWPTIRYFNKETGIEGASYVKKTDDAMCTELGNEEYMFSYIEEAGNTALCSVASGKGCSEKELGYIEKMSAKSPSEVLSQLVRLEKMGTASMKPELLDWMKRRTKILRQMSEAPTNEEL